MSVGVHCWTAGPADEHVSYSQSALAPPVGHACEGTRHTQTMQQCTESGGVSLHTRNNTPTHARTHACTPPPPTHTHNCRNSLCSITKVNILCIMAAIGHSPPLLWIQNICLPFGSGLHCSGVNVRGLKCQSPILGGKTFPQTFRFVHSLLTVECTMNEGSGLV